MTQHISQTDPCTLATEEILREIDSFRDLAENVLKRWSALLAELKRRRVPNAMFQHPVLRFWESINNETLDVEAAVRLADRRDGHMIRAVLPLPSKQQVAIAHGEPVPVAVLSDAGQIKSDDVPIHRMSRDMIARAFGPEGIRSVHEQAEMIRSENKIERHGMITVLRDESMLKIGNQKVKPEDLRGPLMVLGYRLDLTRGAPCGAT